MTEAQCDQLLEMLKKHRWPSKCRRINIAARVQNQAAPEGRAPVLEEDKEPVI